MDIKEKINLDLKKAMKESDSFSKGLLRTILGEFSRVEYSSKKEDPNSLYIKVLKKMKKSLGEINNETSKREIEIIDSYLPQELSKEFIEEKIDSIISSGNNNIGYIMNYFKENHVGLFDGKMVSSLAKEKLKK